MQPTATKARITCQRGSGLSTCSVETLITLGYSQDLTRREQQTARENDRLHECARPRIKPWLQQTPKCVAFVSNKYLVMRRILIAVVILVACIITGAVLWIFNGRQFSLFIDRFGTVETAAAQINSITYEGSGTGGILHVNDLALSLSAADSTCSTPNIGSTKDGRLALAGGGKVFAFGPPRSEAENLAAVPSAGDDASVKVRRSVLSWPTLFDLNFVTGHSPSWKRHLYYQVRWHKQNGAKLEMLWRYEQYFYSDQGWASGFMTREGSTGLIRVDIHL
jgi:hypothetical protein